jgi:hypothetical protein
MGHRPPKMIQPPSDTVRKEVVSRNTDLRVVALEEQRRADFELIRDDLKKIRQHELECSGELPSYIAAQALPSFVGIIVGFWGCVLLVYGLFFAEVPAVVLPFAAAMMGLPASAGRLTAS